MQRVNGSRSCHDETEDDEADYFDDDDYLDDSDED